MLYKKHLYLVVILDAGIACKKLENYNRYYLVNQIQQSKTFSFGFLCYVTIIGMQNLMPFLEIILPIVRLKMKWVV